MELVRGIPITAYCDQNQLPPQERLELFVSVCNAIQHAHQKGVIHRDIKPSNVLVTSHDGKPVAKVIDFGVAKAIHQPLTERTIYTNFAQMIGTPLYMSPEQAEMSGLDIDTRSDIYSLGVLLYELLTGSTPLEKKHVAMAAHDEIRRLIREEEPPRPSTRLSTSDSLPSIAAQRHTEPAKLSKLVRGDLDWITMKALEKDRTRRYETANGLARDIQRYLADEVVEARPPSVGYRVHKFLRKHRAGALTAGAFLALLLFGVAVSTWQAVRAMRAEADALAERDEKEQARNDADEARHRAEDAADRLREATTLAWSGQLHAQFRHWSSAHAAFEKAVELQTGLVIPYLFRRWMDLDLGLWDRAAADTAEALRLGGPFWKSEDWYQLALLSLHVRDEPRYREACREALRRFGDGADSPGQFGVDNNDALNIVRTCTLTPEPLIDTADLVRRAKHANAFEKVNWKLYIEGLAFYRAGNYEQAIDRFRQSLSLDPNWNARAINYPPLAMAYYRLSKVEEARAALASAEKAIDGWIEAMFQGPVGTMPIPWFDWLECQHYYREAKRLVTGAVPSDDARLRAVRERALAALSLGDAENLLETGRAHAAQGEWEQAASDYGRALDLIPDRLSYFSPAIPLCADMVQTPEIFARLIERRPKDARLWVARGQEYARRHQWKEAVADYARFMEDRPPDDGASFEYASLLLLSGDDASYHRLCQGLLKRYDPKSADAFSASNIIHICTLAPAAIDDTARLVEWAKAWLTNQSHTGWAHARLGTALYRAGRWDEAVRSLHKAEEVHPAWRGHCVTDMFLALAYLRQGKTIEGRQCLDRAEQWLTNANQQLAKYKNGFPPAIHPSDWLTVQVLRRETETLMDDRP
jgi:tetratricopeptide (TPR) repeat protein